MMMALVACLVVVSLYLAKRVSDVNGENTALRAQVASLKKQLVRRRSPGHA
jgi:cell division protein FtsL